MLRGPPCASLLLRVWSLACLVALRSGSASTPLARGQPAKDQHENRPAHNDPSGITGCERQPPQPDLDV